MRYFSIILATLGLAYSVYEFRKSKQKAVNGLGKVNPNRPPKIRIIYSKKQKASDRHKVAKSDDVYDLFKSVWSSQIQTREEMYVLFLNINNQILGYHILSSGGITSTIADLRLLFAVALKSLATSIILAHNHPSGNLKPSESDIKLTTKIKEAGKLMDISLLDHLIITDDGYYSFSDEGQL